MQRIIQNFASKMNTPSRSLPIPVEDIKVEQALGEMSYEIPAMAQVSLTNNNPVHNIIINDIKVDDVKIEYTPVTISELTWVVRAEMTPIDSPVCTVKGADGFKG